MSRDVQMGKLVVQLCGFHDLDMTDRELVCNRWGRESFGRIQSIKNRLKSLEKRKLPTFEARKGQNCIYCRGP